MTHPTFDARDYHGSGPENYQRFFVPAIGAPLAAELIASAELAPGERILDVACGTGAVTRLAAQEIGETGKVAGLDINPGMLAVARATTPVELGVDWFETGAEAIPLPDRSFDVVLCQMGLQFMADKPQALKEIRRILAPGGRLVLNLPGPTPALFSTYAEALAKHIDPKCAGFVNVVFSLHDPDEIRALMTDAGFETVDVQAVQTTLRLPPAEEFVWQYIHSTPMAGLVAAATDSQRAALRDDVVERWKPYGTAGGMSLDVRMTTVRAS